MTDATAVVYIVLYKDRKYAEQYIFHGDEALREKLLDCLTGITILDYEQDCDCERIENCPHIMYNGLKVDYKTGKLEVPDGFSLREMAKMCVDLGENDNDDWCIRSIVKVQDGRGEKWIN